LDVRTTIYLCQFNCWVIMSGRFSILGLINSSHAGGIILTSNVSPGNFWIEKTSEMKFEGYMKGLIIQKLSLSWAVLEASVKIPKNKDL
jgi:hypothetical protein